MTTIRLQPNTADDILLDSNPSSEFQIMKATTFSDLKIWQEAAGFTSEIIKSTEVFGNELIHSLLSESCIQLVSRISEGFGKGSPKDFLDELFIARGLLTKIQSLLLITENFPDATKDLVLMHLMRSESLERELNLYISNLQKKGERSMAS
jgi:four helix bundle protein